MFPDILLLENTLIQFYFYLCAFTQSFFANNVKYLPCLTTESNLKPDKSHFIYSQTIFSFGGNFSKLLTVLGTEVRSKTKYYALSYTILLEEVLAVKECPKKHGGSDAISMTTVSPSSW